MALGGAGAALLALAVWPAPWRLLCVQLEAGEGDAPALLASLPEAPATGTCAQLGPTASGATLKKAVRETLRAMEPAERQVGLDWTEPVDGRAAEAAFRLLIDGAAGVWTPRRTAWVLRWGDRTVFVGPDACRGLPAAELRGCLGL